MATHLEKREKSGKFMKNCQIREKLGKNKIVLTNVLENVDIVHFISIFCQSIRVIHVISVNFCYTADILELGKNILNQGKVIEKSGKVKTLCAAHRPIFCRKELREKARVKA